MASGTRLGPDEILLPIRKGGMGEVYQAKGAKLDREVAIEVLPCALASVNPNIARIYGLVEESGYGKTMATELVDGAKLKSPVPLERRITNSNSFLESGKGNLA